MAEEENPMAEAEAQLYRRIQELRARARSERAPGAAGDTPAAMPDLRTILARAEANVGELRQTAAALEQSLPETVERAIERAMDERSTPRRLVELRELVRSLAGQMDQVNRDLLAERLGRIEDLELLVDLISTGMASLRQDVADVSGTHRAHDLVGERRRGPARPAAAGDRRAPPPVGRARPLPPDRAARAVEPLRPARLTLATI